MRRWLLGILAIVVLAGGGVWFLVRSSLESPDRAVAGDCLRDHGRGQVPYRIIACADGRAQYAVLTAVEADGNPCVDVPTASRLAPIDGKVLCIGRKGADPARAANVARDGDCLRFERVAETERLPCSDPRANVKVLRRLAGARVGGSPYLNKDPCAEVKGTALLYGYQWHFSPALPPVTAASGEGISPAFCLARANEPPPADPKARPACRYVTGPAVLAAFNKASGRTHTAVRVEGGGMNPGCQYILNSGPRFGSDGDTITIRLSADTSWPPADTDPMEIDGLPAAWKDNTTYGGGTLYVQRPTGSFQLHMFVGNGFPKPRETATAIYRAAAKHVP